MKLKGISKLVLAGTALAATAATLTTATYAWYVTNSSVEATNVSGQVNGDSIDGSLFISKNKVVTEDATSYDAPEKYVTSITLSDVVGDKLNPQSKATEDVYKYTKATEFAADTTYYEIDGTTKTYTALATQPADADAFAALGKTVYTKSADPIATAGQWVDKDGKSTAGTFITFKFWLRSSKGGNVTFTLKTDNKTVTAVTQQALTEGDFMPTGTKLGDAFVADAVPALRMERTKQDGIGAASVAAATSKVFAVDAITTNYTPTSSVGFATIGSNTDANKYFYNVLSSTGYNTDLTSGASEKASTFDGTLSDFQTVNLTANTDTLFTFKVWLEGSDADCWDSCRGQLFDFNFGIELASAGA